MEIGGGSEIREIDQSIETEVSDSMDFAESSSSTDDQDETDQDSYIVP